MRAPSGRRILAAAAEVATLYAAAASALEQGQTEAVREKIRAADCLLRELREMKTAAAENSPAPVDPLAAGDSPDPEEVRRVQGELATACQQLQRALQTNRERLARQLAQTRRGLARLRQLRQQFTATGARYLDVQS